MPGTARPRRNAVVTQLRLTWRSGPTITLADGQTELTYRPTPSETAALIRRLAGYLGTWHRLDVDLTDTDPDCDPNWQPPAEQRRQT